MIDIKMKRQKRIVHEHANFIAQCSPTGAPRQTRPFKMNDFVTRVVPIVILSRVNVPSSPLGCRKTRKIEKQRHSNLSFFEITVPG